MSSRNWSNDGELMRDVREALTPVPTEQSMIDAARAAYAWRTVSADLELAVLLYDSRLDQTTLVRGPASVTPRILVFGRGNRRVEIELSETGIEGQLVPPEPGLVRLLTATGSATETTADEVGCFAFSAVRRTPMRLECIVTDGRFITDWVMF